MVTPPSWPTEVPSAQTSVSVALPLESISSYLCSFQFKLNIRVFETLKNHFCAVHGNYAIRQRGSSTDLSWKTASVFLASAEMVDPSHESLS